MKSTNVSKTNRRRKMENTNWTFPFISLLFKSQSCCFSPKLNRDSRVMFVVLANKRRWNVLVDVEMTYAKRFIRWLRSLQPAIDENGNKCGSYFIWWFDVASDLQALTIRSIKIVRQMFLTKLIPIFSPWRMLKRLTWIFFDKILF